MLKNFILNKEINMTNTPTLDSIQAELDRLKAVQGNNLSEPDLPYVVIRTYSAC